MKSEDIGLYLTELRKYYKITQDELADKLGITRQAISKWENGKTIPDVEILLSLSELYGISINDILKADLSQIKYQKEIVFPKESKEKKNIVVIGCGRWGTFIGWYLDKIGHRVSIYGRPTSKNMQNLISTRENEYLHLSNTIQLTTSLKEIESTDYIIVSVDSQNLLDVMQNLAMYHIKKKIIILCMKGIEIDTGRRLSQVASDTLDHSNHIAVWLGPGHVQDFYRGIPNCMVIDSNEELIKNEIIHCFSSDLIRFYYGTDMIGNEIGAAAKNVIGIAAGMLDGLDLSSLKGSLMSRATNEISHLIIAMGGNGNTVYGLSHLGDYEATLFSEHSQNRKYGKCIITKEFYDKLAEGYYTTKAIHNLGKAYGVDLPICEAVYQILYENKNPKSILKKLFTRSLKNEFI